MQRKYVVLIATILLIVAVGCLYFWQINRKTLNSREVTKYVGKIDKVIDTNTISIKGNLTEQLSTNSPQAYTFKITPETVLKKTIYHFDKSAKGLQTPKMETVTGNFTDLKPNVRILEIDSMDKPDGSKTLKATSLDYVVQIIE